MKVVLSTIGRFHILPLAFELQRMGVLERVYSGFPWYRLAREGVMRKNVTTFPIVRPLIMGARHLPFEVSASAIDRLHQISVIVHDTLVAKCLPESDIFVGHEGVGFMSGPVAQKRGAIYICDRGCSHMAWREKILEEEQKRFGLPSRSPPLTFEREIAEYDLADAIVVASNVARNSFINSGIPAEKISVVRYGVNTESFHPVSKPPPGEFNILFVGGLSPRKGAYDLLEGFRLAAIPGAKLTIAGQIDSEVQKRHADLLNLTNIIKAGHVPHDELKWLMSQSHVLVLPSIEDGFGMVVAEAMACGCPVIVSENTGAADVVDEGKNGYIVPIRSPHHIASRLTKLADDRALQEEMSINATTATRSSGSWTNYASQMLHVYEELLNARR